jgi:hypothetical protein
LNCVSPPEEPFAFTFIAGTDGEFVLGFVESDPTCCVEASENILLTFFDLSRTAGVFAISSRF